MIGHAMQARAVEYDGGGLSRLCPLISSFLDERRQRLLAALMVGELGRGGQPRVA